MGKNTLLVVSVLMLSCVWFSFPPNLAAAAAEPEAEKPALVESDCAKCHDREPAEIAEKGAAHQTEIGCRSCHEGHRPATADNIPACSACHAGAPHYELADCNSCHNPHAPLDISLEGELKEVCLTCHAQQGQEVAASPSAHGEVSCNFCHADTHGMIPECVQCHEPHSAQMTQADCGSCHQAHQPLQLNYAAEIASVQCAACHETAFNQLSASQTRHSDLSCSACHPDRHGAIAACADCHGAPHAAGMHQKFPNCGDCHGIAHDLNNWQGQEEAAPR